MVWNLGGAGNYAVQRGKGGSSSSKISFLYILSGPFIISVFFEYDLTFDVYMI